MTNNEIIEKYGKDSKLAPDDVYSREVLLIMLNEAQVEGYKEGQAVTIKKLEELAEDIYGKYIGEEHIEKTKGRWLGVMECIGLLKGEITIQDRIEEPEE